jgi:tetratricopeptide (TPR) repeat protein
MNIFKNVFGKKEPEFNHFVEGDIFYSMLNDRFHLCKLLRHDKEQETYHVLCYAPVDKLPEKSKIAELNIAIYHSPIYDRGFTDPVFFSHETISENDLIGYHEYLKQTNFAEYLKATGRDPDKVIAEANQCYREAYALTDEKKYDEAIAKYSEAIELFPLFYEAIDNRAFCKMDLGRWEDAIADFKLSLEVNPKSTLAEFSIGECYFKMKKYHEAEKQFKKTLEIEPENKLALEFMVKTLKIINGKLPG